VKFPIYSGEVKTSLKTFRAIDKHVIIRGSYFSVKTLQDPQLSAGTCMFHCTHQLVHGHMWIYKSTHVIMILNLHDVLTLS
jgi:hypothetical protein